MEQPRNRSWTLAWQPTGPLAAHLDAYTALLFELGYSTLSTQWQTRVVAEFSRWLESQGVVLHDLAERHCEQYMQYRMQHWCRRGGESKAIYRMLKLMRAQGVFFKPVPQAPILSDAQRISSEYATYLHDKRSLAKASISTYVPLVLQFLTEHFGNGPVNLDGLCSDDVSRFVQRQAQHISTTRAKLMTTALRSFLQYALYSGFVRHDLGAAVPAVANWTKASIPRSIAPGHVIKLLEHCDARMAAGRRDRAVLLLLSQLGLRAREITAISLDDIDWEAGSVRVPGKRGNECRLPLPFEVGESIAAYLIHDRPQCNDRSLFLTVHPPFRSLMAPHSIDAIVKRAFKRAGIESTRKGAHQFRHALATQLLRQGASLTEIGDLLRHCSPQTTAIYAKVDFTALRALALPWPGGMR